MRAAAWYDRRSSGLGDRFVEAVRRSVERVIADPESFGVAPAGLRYVQTQMFPYVVLFDVVDESLIILGVLHTARSMDKWRERLEDEEVGSGVGRRIYHSGIRSPS